MQPALLLAVSLHGQPGTHTRGQRNATAEAGFLPLFPGGNPQCWNRVYTFDHCCNFRETKLQASLLGSLYHGGRQQCWAGAFTYERCCARPNDGCLPPKVEADYNGGQFDSPGILGVFAPGATAILTCASGFKPYPNAARGPKLTCGPAPDFAWLGSVTCFPAGELPPAAPSPPPLSMPPPSPPLPVDAPSHPSNASGLEWHLVALVAVLTAGVVALAYICTVARAKHKLAPAIQLASVGGEIVGDEVRVGTLGGGSSTTHNALIVDANVVSNSGSGAEPSSPPSGLKAPLGAARP